MKEYRKIANVFKFDEKFRTVVGLNEPFESLKNLHWIGTEKVDGSNTRICWDGHEITIKGHTDNAQFQGDSEKFLKDLFLTKEMEYVFEQIFEDKEAIIFGEVYGPKIQAGGGLYSSTPNFIIFDIDIDGFHLKRESILDIAQRLNIKVVPVVFEGTLEDAKKYVSEHHMSTINDAHEMEGLVLELPLDIFDKKGEKIKCKCKYRDMLKAGMIN